MQPNHADGTASPDIRLSKEDIILFWLHPNDPVAVIVFTV